MTLFYADLAVLGIGVIVILKIKLAYQYQRLWRKLMTGSVISVLHTIKDNHSTVGLKLNYDLLVLKLEGFIKGEMYQHNLIGYVPFLYNECSRLLVR